MHRAATVSPITPRILAQPRSIHEHDTTNHPLLRGLHHMAPLAGRHRAGGGHPGRGQPAAARGVGVDGDTFTGVNFDWSVAWDAETWKVTDEDITGGSDYFVLESAVLDFEMIGFAARGDFDRIGDCTKNWVDSVGHGDGATDLARMEEPDGITVRSDAAAATFSYRQELERTTAEMVGYVQCLPVNEAGARIALNIMTVAGDLDAMAPGIEAVLQAIGTPEAEITSLAADDDETRDAEDDDARGDGSTSRGDDDSSNETNDDRRSGQDGDSGVDGATFTGVFHDWSVSWDEDDWAFDQEDNRDGYDTLWLENASGEFATAVFLTDPDAIDAEDCASGWLRSMAGVEGVDDFERDDTLVTPSAPDDAVGYADIYAQDGTDVAAYVECRMLPGDDAAIAMILTAEPIAYEGKIERFADVLDTLEMGGGSGSNDGADDVPDAESGIDIESASYVSPTYGFELEWSGTDFAAIVEEEEVDTLPDDLALDRLPLFMPGAKLYIEARVDYGGNAAQCIETESEILVFHDGVTAIEPVLNDAGFPEAGESDAVGEYATFRLTQEDDGETIARIAYVECRALAEDEAVVVISFYAREKTFEDAWEAASAVIDSISYDVR